MIRKQFYSSESVLHVSLKFATLKLDIQSGTQSLQHRLNCFRKARWVDIADFFPQKPQRSKPAVPHGDQRTLSENNAVAC